MGMTIAVRAGDEAFQVQMVCLDELVPADDDLRRIDLAGELGGGPFVGRTVLRGWG